MARLLQNSVVTSPRGILCLASMCAASLGVWAWSLPAVADGIARPPRSYRGSLEEASQEGIIIFHEGQQAGESVEDLILKITVKGAATDFAWVVPFPNEPKVTKEDPLLFSELFNYVESQRTHGGKSAASDGQAAKTESTADGVKVLSRQTVGSFDVAVVRETQAGALNDWLDREGYQKVDGVDDVLAYYRDKGYVYACIKVAAEAAKGQEVETHPLRFTFRTGGRDGVYFPMKLSAAQKEPFHVNLYVFHRFWLNDGLSRFGYRHRGFTLSYRDWDTPRCEPNGGKAWFDPANDPLLKSSAGRLPTVAALFQKLRPGERFYLTNIQATGLKPADVRDWLGDLWLFPYYTDRRMVPHDARPEGPARHLYPDVEIDEDGLDPSVVTSSWGWAWAVGIAGVGVVALVAWRWRATVLGRRRGATEV